MEVTVLHEGPNKGKPPHNAYGDLDAAGVKVIWCDDLKDSAACLGALGGASFGAVVDNWSKSPEDIAPYADAAVAPFGFVKLPDRSLTTRLHSSSGKSSLGFTHSLLLSSSPAT